MGGNETLVTVVKDIAGKLERWRGLKEAQTIQAIILRVLQALGWNIWNPYEVVPQDTGTRSYRPDFLLCAKKDEPVLVLEAKALDRTLTDEDRMQVVNYANSQNIRWSVLTNGKLWEFFDNRVEARAPEKRVLYFQLDNPSAAKYLEKLLSKSFWEGESASLKLEGIAKEIQKEIETQQNLAEITVKLSKALEEGYERSEKGLRKAIEKELSANEQELAKKHFKELAQKLLTSHPSGSPDFMGKVKEVLKSIHNPTASGLTVEVNGERFSVKTWRELYWALVQTAILLGKDDVVERLREKRDIVSKPERKTKDGKPYPRSAFKELHSGEYLFVHHSTKAITRKIKQLLRDLKIPSSSLHVESKGRVFKLP